MDDITTQRTILRAWREDDAPAVAFLLGDPEVMRFSDAGALDADAQRGWLQASVASGSRASLLGRRAIAVKSNGQVVGYAGLLGSAVAAQPSEAEFGVRLSRRWWGQGIASEAGTALLGAARSDLDLKRIIASVDPGNQASITLLERLGFVRAGDVMLPGYTHPDHRYVCDVSGSR